MPGDVGWQGQAQCGVGVSQAQRPHLLPWRPAVQVLSRHRQRQDVAGGAHALSLRLAILDEVGQVRGPNDPFVEAVETAQGVHDDPLLIVISTQAATDGDCEVILLTDHRCFDLFC